MNRTSNQRSTPDKELAHQQHSSSCLNSPQQCAELFITLYRKIRIGAAKFHSDSRLIDIDAQINSFASHCDPRQADFLRILCDYVFKRKGNEESIFRIEHLLQQHEFPPPVRLRAELLLIYLTSTTEPWDTNRRRREDTLARACHAKEPVIEAILLTNWAFKLFCMGDYPAAQRKITEAEAAFNRLGDTINTDEEATEAFSRLITHKAKLLLGHAAHSGARAVENVLPEIDRLYEEATRRDQHNDHRRVNEAIEWAETLLSAYDSAGHPPLKKIESVLQKATTGLDTHNCDLCTEYHERILCRLEESKRQEVEQKRTKRRSIEKMILRYLGAFATIVAIILGLFQLYAIIHSTPPPAAAPRR